MKNSYYDGIDIIEDELRQPTLFKDESKLSIDYVPSYLPHRENELRLLARMFSDVLSQPGKLSQKVIITGSIGTGKTAIAKLFGEHFTNYGKKRNINLHYIHINCRVIRTDYMILKTIVKHFIPGLPDRGLSPDELFEMLLFTLENNDAYLLITLDEVDFAIKKSGVDLIYRLTRVGDSKLNPIQRISLIFILRETMFSQFLDLSTLSSLQRNLIHLKKYTAEQLYDIISLRVKEAFFDGVVTENAIRLTADLAAEWGDARYALELIWRAGKYAEFKRSSVVDVSHIRQAQSELHPFVSREVLFSLSRHHLLLLISIARASRGEQQLYVPFKKIKQIYLTLCEEYGLPARKNTQLWEYLKDLELNGIIALRTTQKGKRGRSTLVSLENIPSDILEREVTNILK
ncbi:MAG: ORC1-type DNA replication protein [Candidatus Asgardarchaeia archaeon]